MPAFKKLKAQLFAIDTTAWPIEQQADWHVLMAEMNGYDFNYRILQPWNRDPAFYKSVWTERSDVPVHEGLHTME
jgi:alpha-N-acetylglucosamine transferase